MGIVQMQQIRIGTNPHGFEADETAFLKQQEKLQATLLALCPAHLWHDGSYSAGCSRPILIGRHHQQQLENLHEALTIAITDIVQRWWTDSDARFPEQMPLEKEEGDLLKVGVALTVEPSACSTKLDLTSDSGSTSKSPKVI